MASGQNQIKSPAQIKKIMERYGLKFHKSLGQNFLFDEHYLNKIVESGQITKEDTVLEIGPGLGVLTTRLAEKAKKVIAVEIDRNLIPILEDVTKDYGNVTVINQDILKTDINSLLQHETSVKIIANLPYYITTPILMKLLEEKQKVDCIVVMIQKEVAQRIVASPGTKDYGALTLTINYYSNPNILFLVPPGAFIPAPKVDSAVIRLDILEHPPVSVRDETMLFRLIKAAFGQRRKTYANALSSYFPKLGKTAIKTALAECRFPENCRGETLSLADFAILSEKFCKLEGN